LLRFCEVVANLDVMDAVQPFIEVIQTAVPHLTVHSAAINEEGQYNHVLVVNENVIFRFVWH
jgi:hypothetical protein